MCGKLIQSLNQILLFYKINCSVDNKILAFTDTYSQKDWISMELLNMIAFCPITFHPNWMKWGLKLFDWSVILKINDDILSISG
jgi:hypothetical protein